MLADDLITFKLTSKQMARSAKKCDQNVEMVRQLVYAYQQLTNILTHYIL